MATLNIDVNPGFSLEVDAREADEYSKLVFIRFQRHYHSEAILGADELFLTPDQTEQLARFLMRQADEVRMAQRARKMPE